MKGTGETRVQGKDCNKLDAGHDIKLVFEKSKL